ncbi:hypothetical protein Tco_1062974 [Tanacetum coccineum]
MGGDGDGVLKAKLSGVIGESERMMSIGAFGDIGFCFGDEVLASSWVSSINNYLGGLIVIFGFLVALAVEECEDAMEMFEVEDELGR